MKIYALFVVNQKQPFTLYGSALLHVMYRVKETNHFENCQFSLMVYGFFGLIWWITPPKAVENYAPLFAEIFGIEETN